MSYYDLKYNNYSTPRKSNVENEEKPLSEWKIAFFGLVLSLTVISAKLFHANRDFLYKAIFENELYGYEAKSSEGELMFKYTWRTVVKYSQFWFPALCGSLATWFTWLIVYLDSRVPGVQPPSPLSPSKYKVQSGHTFHLNYLFAVFIGLFVSVYLYTAGVYIHF